MVRHVFNLVIKWHGTPIMYTVSQGETQHADLAILAVEYVAFLFYYKSDRNYRIISLYTIVVFH